MFLFIAVIFQIVATVIIAVNHKFASDMGNLLYDLLYDLLKKGFNKKTEPFMFHVAMQLYFKLVLCNI